MRQLVARTGLLLSLLAPALAAVGAAQSRTISVHASGPPITAGDSVVVTAIGQRYAGGWLRRLMLGREYRDLWATPVSIPVLDLATFGGGLTPISAGGGQQTHALRLKAADGREFYFRSIDKDPTPNLPPKLQATIASSVVQDQTSSTHPTAPLVVAPLLQAAGVLHGEPRLFILPDHERLGEFRKEFAGVIGMLEARVAQPAAGEPTWGGASEIIGGDELFERVAKSPDDRVDVRALLRARLMDMLVGDWDRHRDQWSWVRFGTATPRVWLPVPRDRDFAMISYDGLLLSIGRNTLPQLITFRPKYPAILGLTWNGRELDRHWLMELERPVWDSITREIQWTITDSVIEAAVRQLPPEHYAKNGAFVVDALKHRRDALSEIAGRFYDMLSDAAEVYATGADEFALLHATDENTVELSLIRRSGSSATLPLESSLGPRSDTVGSVTGEPYLRRSFTRAETKELRLFLGGGNDSALVTGAPLGIRVRVIGDSGSDVLVDSARSAVVRMYDSDTGTVVSQGTSFDRRPYAPPPRRSSTEIPVRDWGHRWQPSATFVSSAPDVGLFVGVGRILTVYGFRKLPFASQHRFRVGVATGPWTYRADYVGQFRRESSAAYKQLLIHASGIDVLRFSGFGNELDPAPGGVPGFYRVTSKQYLVEPSLVTPLAGRVELTAGPTVRYVSTDRRADRFITQSDPYGAGNFGEVGGHLALTLDTRNRAVATTRGVLITVAGSAYPTFWDVERAYGEVHGEAATFLTARLPLDPTLALRVGGKKLWGPFPYFDAAFIGGSGTVRLGRQNRYAGDASAFANAELRVALGQFFLGTPCDFGVFGLADAGRVFVQGEESSKWHGAGGGGIWLSVLERANTVSVAWAHSAERTALYAQIGFGF